MPPMLIGMMARYCRENMADKDSQVYKILDTSYEFMSLHTLTTIPSIAGICFERQAAYLMRLRLLYLRSIKCKQFTFTLKDLLCIEGKLRGRNENMWWKRESGDTVFQLPEDPDFNIVECSADEIAEAIQRGGSTRGTIYIPNDAQKPGYDFVIHLPGEKNISIVAQAKFSFSDSTTRLSNPDILHCLSKIANTHKELASKTAAIAILCCRECYKNVSAAEYTSGNCVINRVCKEIAVLDKCSFLDIVPYSMQSRMLI